MRSSITKYFNTYSDAAPLAVFRIGFGIMMLASIIRFWLNGWIEKLYITPKFHFSYYGFEWVKPLGDFTYLLFIICGLAALFVALGFKYRIAIVTFFLSFTYIELMDKTTYLNHYYFISILSFLMIFLPAHVYYSLDAWRNNNLSFQRIPAWFIDSIKLLLAIVYFYAGLAKINSDWLIRAMPLKIWLPSKYDIPLLGDLMQQEWVHYAFSWSGMLYDLLIPFLLLWKRTRFPAFILVIIFHVLTRVLFPIGMFPYIMIVSALIFFIPPVHHRILGKISSWFRIKKSYFDNGRYCFYKPKKIKFIRFVIVLFFAIQILFPWRYLAYPGELFWTEEGFRFSWRVMLMEKAGFAQFKVVDAETGKRFYVDNSDFLTPFQEKQMSFQPDFILEYAHFLADHFRKQGHENIEVYVESYVGLNGRKSEPYISPEVNLLNFADSFEHKTFILPFNDEIKGL
ncbi:HTTM domain-containing protein [Christiangramia sabulilitoris]|uniref:HTTM domain-containing protein n=1 Tax=Christiangramia sabulilitoris TaxID=2583991 RepID=A0A550I386_9FLAO|nr:HTTM domain-containing protein [Christiangramia sabulilitoris]TRO65447.1 HTTM domain-containing protein [Christiangramia sabulilitoris]